MDQIQEEHLNIYKQIDEKHIQEFLQKFMKIEELQENLKKHHYQSNHVLYEKVQKHQKNQKKQKQQGSSQKFKQYQPFLSHSHSKHKKINSQSQSPTLKYADNHLIKTSRNLEKSQSKEKYKNKQQISLDQLNNKNFNIPQKSNKIVSSKLKIVNNQMGELEQNQQKYKNNHSHHQKRRQVIESYISDNDNLFNKQEKQSYKNQDNDDNMYKTIKAVDNFMTITTQLGRAKQWH
ncbi:hypothetical protein PPERSA_07482 [Pseudocohnilembus persalinus]|uniref:Uncharacterized protein n=1 Tax=Pseudocohnilembus persalinus TaxID=266149 RepID=A0A0V0R2C0_PSEPJ|nr:hypothetical protein PPERSA_07482 [Pseudocohnilembus persalinus]|eukprot:KRX08670.1 hypothetical protein PPERSA_07482 [Pseudocohnilembus persalinus]